VPNSRMSAAIAAPVSSRCRPTAAAASSRRQVPSPTTGTLARSRPRPRFQFAMSATPRSVRSPEFVMSVNDPRPTGLARRVAAEDFPLMPADDRVRAPSLAGRTASAGPIAALPCLVAPPSPCTSRHRAAPRRDWQLRWSSDDGSPG
jgi:hypothetical protein